MLGGIVKQGSIDQRSLIVYLHHICDFRGGPIPFLDGLEDRAGLAKRHGRSAWAIAIDDQPQASLANTMSAHNYVKAALAALKAGKPVEKSTTKAYGCGVKYGTDG